MHVKHSQPSLEKDDFAYIEYILASKYVASGHFVHEMERHFSQLLSMRYCIATSSGTASLHLALLALGIKAGAEVVVPSYACAAILNAIHYVDAVPVIADVDRDSFNLTAETVKARITAKTAAVVVTHTFGYPADLDGLAGLGIPVVEDCAQALGAVYKGKTAGSHGAVSVFSLYATKMITSGMGGAICTNNESVGRELQDLTEPDERDSYRVRYNYKMSDLSAGLGLSQLKKLDRFIERRMKIAQIYRQAFCEFPVSFQQAVPGSIPNHYRFVIVTSQAEKIIQFARDRGIDCDRPIYRPLHRYFSGTDPFCEASDFLWESVVSIPIYPALGNEEVSLIVSVLREALQKYC